MPKFGTAKGILSPLRSNMALHHGELSLWSGGNVANLVNFLNTNILKLCIIPYINPSGEARDAEV